MFNVFQHQNVKWHGTSYKHCPVLSRQNAAKARGAPQTDADTAVSAPEWTHLQDTVISTLVAGMLPLMGSKSRTVAVASTLSITSPSMRAREPGQLPGPRESL